MILPATEMSLVSTTTPAALVKALTMGSKEYVASAGASSILDQMIFEFCVVMFSPWGFYAISPEASKMGGGAVRSQKPQRTTRALPAFSDCIQYAYHGGLSRKNWEAYTKSEGF